MLPPLEAFGDRDWQNIEQQQFRFFLFLNQPQVLGFELFALIDFDVT